MVAVAPDPVCLAIADTERTLPTPNPTEPRRNKCLQQSVLALVPQHQRRKCAAYLGAVCQNDNMSGLCGARSERQNFAVVLHMLCELRAHVVVVAAPSYVAFLSNHTTTHVLGSRAHLCLGAISWLIAEQHVMPCLRPVAPALRTPPGFVAIAPWRRACVGAPQKDSRESC